jgi:hypothetical protein
LSRITSGPLTPPMVLYRILGLIEVIRGSTISGAMAAEEDAKGGAAVRRTVLNSENGTNWVEIVAALR